MSIHSCCTFSPVHRVKVRWWMITDRCMQVNCSNDDTQQDYGWNDGDCPLKTYHVWIWYLFLQCDINRSNFHTIFSFEHYQPLHLTLSLVFVLNTFNDCCFQLNIESIGYWIFSSSNKITKITITMSSTRASTQHATSGICTDIVIRWWLAFNHKNPTIISAFYV